MKLKLRLSREARRKFLNFRRSQTRIRPGFEAQSHEQEPDTNQARIQSLEPRASKSQTRIRPGFKAESHEQEQSQEPDANQARIRDQKPGARVQQGGVDDLKGTI